MPRKARVEFPGAVQIFTYDGRNRQTSSTWSDGTTAPAFVYDPASRVTQISNADAVIKNVYFDDNTLKSQEEWATAAASYHRTVNCTYNVDGKRATIVYPSGKNYDYQYTPRNDFWSVRELPSGIFQAAYIYDLNGNVSTRYVGNYWIVTDASQRDPMNQVKHLEHRFSGTTRSFDYTYNSMGSRTSIKRDGGTAENYGYDLAQEVTTGIENGAATTYGYDANGNRTVLNGGGSYVTNSLNQQTTFNGQTVGPDPKGNVASYGSTGYVYDAQNRLKSVTTGGVTSTFKYDGLNRKISQTIGGVTTYNVWDGWNLIEERTASNGLLHTYLYGAGEIIERITGTTQRFYFQDGLGSTSHFAEESGMLLESYKYGTFGGQTVYAPNGTVRTTGTAYDIRHLYTGQLWMPQAGLYDYRNRAYWPALTRFLQPDPIGFAGDPTNLYRYCGNNPVNCVDPSGLIWGEVPALAGGVGGTVVGAVGGFSYGVANQTYSYAAGNGFSWGQIGINTAVGAGVGGATGLVVGAAISADPFAITESSLAATAITGLVMAAVDNHLRPPTPPSPTPPAPPQPSIPALLERPPELPPVFTAPDGSQIDGNGNRLHGRSGGGENGGSTDSGRFSPFSPGANSFTNANGDSVVAGSGPGGFQVSVGGSIVGLYLF